MPAAFAWRKGAPELKKNAKERAEPQLSFHRSEPTGRLPGDHGTRALSTRRPRIPFQNDLASIGFLPGG